jgi:hypothetical protein
VVVVGAASYHVRLLYRSNKSALQMLYSLHSSLADDEINQKRGMVIIAYGLGQTEDMNAEIRNSIKECADLAQGFPVRIER